MTTAIETYLNSLSENVLTIDIEFKCITSLPNLTRFKNLKKLNCSYNELTSIPTLPQNLKVLDCYNNQLTSLPTLPQNLEYLNCFDNQLISLPTLPQNLKELNCLNNQLTSLPTLPQNLEELYCSNNQLTSLPTLPQNLEKLYCYNNHLTSLHLNENLQELYCANNQLISLRLNTKLVVMDYINNPIYEIINTNDIDKIKQKLRVLNQFKYLYYSLKFKKRFRDLLWVKIREPNIREKYSYAYLVANLHEDTDLDDLLKNW